jgi:hypothetical protein
MFLTTIGCYLPNWLRWAISGVMRYLVQDEMMARLIEASRAKSTTELQQWRVRKEAYCLKVRSYVRSSFSLLLFLQGFEGYLTFVLVALFHPRFLFGHSCGMSWNWTV